MISKRKAATAAKAAALLGLSLTLPACASIVRGTSQPVSFQSTPPSASVGTSNGFQCSSTPCTVRMPRREAFVATFRHEGFEEGTVAVKPKVSLSGLTIYFGNAILGGIIGGIIDNVTGAYNDLSPDPVEIELKPITSSSVSEPAEISEEPMGPSA